MAMTKKIKLLLAESEITQRDLADKLGISEPTLSKKIKLDNWRESDLDKIAEVCGCRFVGSFVRDEEK